MADFLLELFSEEIPARMQANAAEHLSTVLSNKLLEQHLSPTLNIQLSVYATPRRLAIWVQNLPSRQPDTVEERRGPKTNAPAAAIEGFLRSTGLTMDQLKKGGEGKGETYFATIEKKGRDTAQVLKEIVEQILGDFPWPKSMRWSDHAIRWVRPLHNILCIFDGKVVPVQFGPITANNLTYGHRFLAPKAITVNDPAEYEALLKDASVRADAAKRRELIVQQIGKLAAQLGGAIIPDEGLLDEVNGLVEMPIALLGNIDADYMELPQEVLIIVMRSHQKYFALRDSSGKLAPHFITVANRVGHDGGKVIIAGNERVLRARFADGRFFWDQDRKRKLDEWAEGLTGVTYHAKLGTIADKIERVAALAEALVEHVPGANAALVKRAVKLAKADLVTGMVGEFPELQGIMGRYYALAQGEDAAVADAIRDHYKPLGPSDAVPSEPTAICVALADKIDTLASMFAIDEKPTGSKDPFALRRTALGILRIILENKLQPALPYLLLLASIPTLGNQARELKLQIRDTAFNQAKRGAINVAELPDRLEQLEKIFPEIDASGEERVVANFRALYAFIIERMKVMLKEQGVRHDVINAALLKNDHNLLRILSRARAVQELLATADGTNLLAAYKRAANILAIEQKKDGQNYSYADLDHNLLTINGDKDELRLVDALNAHAPIIEPALQREDFKEATQLLAMLRPAIDHFFNNVLVNAPEPELRANRLRLLAYIKDSIDKVADFSKIEG